MGASRRVQRVEKEIRQVVANYLLTNNKSPMGGLVSVSRVLASGDLKNAKVYVTMMGDMDKDETLESIQDQSGEIQRQINAQLRMKFCPKLKFYIDETFDHQMKIEKILDDLTKEKEQSDTVEG